MKENTGVHPERVRETTLIEAIPYWYPFKSRRYSTVCVVRMQSALYW